jgi:3-oxoacyl-(acyl-carrier-protein) synthase
MSINAAFIAGSNNLQMIDSYPPGRKVAAAVIAEKSFAGLVTGRGLKYYSRTTKMLTQAALKALLAAGIDQKVEDTPIALLAGSNFGNWSRGLGYICRIHRDGPDAIQPMDAIDSSCSSSVDFCAIRCKTRGAVKMITTGACSSHDAIIEGARMIAGGQAQQVLVAGFERLSPEALVVLEARGCLNSVTCPDSPQQRPYCRNSAGMIPGEGAAALLLENEHSAQKRGARILAHVLGGDFAFSPSHHGKDQAHILSRTGRRALKSAGCPPSTIDWVCGTANGVPANDRIELLALQDMFGNQKHSPAVSSIKGYWGDALGAGGALAAVAAVECLTQAIIPPTPGLETPWPEACGMDLVTGAARTGQMSRLLIMGADADGYCSALVIGK